MSATKITIIGGGGTMGMRISRNLLKFPDKYQLLINELSPKGIEKVQSLGLEVRPAEEIIPLGDFVIMGVPDSVLKKLAPVVIKQLSPGATFVILDPASAVAGEIGMRDDCNFAICHPCHPSFFIDQPTPEARADHYGGEGGFQDVVMSKLNGSDEAFERCRRVCEDMLGPTKHSYVMTPREMAFLEPTLVEVMGATFLYAMAETLEEAVRRGVDRDAAISFMAGHIHNLTANFLGFLGPGAKVSDACLVAMDVGRRLVLREDWRQVWDDDVLDRVIATMLHPEDPKI